MSALSLGVSLGPVRGWAGLAAVLLLTVSSGGPLSEAGPLSVSMWVRGHFELLKPCPPETRAQTKNPVRRLIQPQPRVKRPLRFAFPALNGWPARALLKQGEAGVLAASPVLEQSGLAWHRAGTRGRVPRRLRQRRDSAQGAQQGRRIPAGSEPGPLARQGPGPCVSVSECTDICEASARPIHVQCCTLVLPESPEIL